MKKINALLISLLITLITFLNIYLINKLSHNIESVTIYRIIDGDTLELKDGRKIRLLNINAPEKNSPAHQLSINFLKSLNKSVDLE